MRKRIGEDDGEDNARPPLKPMLPDPPDVETPKTAEALAECISKGVAEALSLATTSKEKTEAVKAATDWYQTRYGKGESGGWGSALSRVGGNGHDVG